MICPKCGKNKIKETFLDTKKEYYILECDNCGWTKQGSYFEW